MGRHPYEVIWRTVATTDAMDAGIETKAEMTVMRSPIEGGGSDGDVVGSWSWSWSWSWWRGEVRWAGGVASAVRVSS